MNYKALSLLVVDDDTLSRTITVRSLRRLGVGGVIEACDGSEALARCDRARFDVIVTDIDMEPMDGLSFIQALRSRATDGVTPIIVLGRQPDLSIAREARQRGASALLLKPITGTLLKQKLDWVLDHPLRSGRESS